MNNILICGSQKFDDENFVFGMLDALVMSSNVPINGVITSKFSGACYFAKEWVEYRNSQLDDKNKIKLFNFDFDMQLAKENTSLYEQLEIPDIILRNDPFFQKGKESLIKSGASIVLAFPNKEGKLGAATLNIKRFATLAQIQTMDCSEAFELMNSYSRSLEQDMAQEKQKMGLVNHHPKNKF